MTTHPAPANAGRPGLAAAAKALGLNVTAFKEALASLDTQDKTDLATGNYNVPMDRQIAARTRAVRGGYAKRGGENLMASA